MAQCPICRREFSCGAAQHSEQPCWCSQLPPLPSVTAATTAQCYCPDCLQRLLQSSRPKDGQQA
ncbi:cysteine-rich CWC family protein [Collimonas arenae]|uniref:cysteine-rich CWC family protein n=1 Tax=Collimonas arenae TaxID=279058 RepID=UPI0009EF4C33|nr:cysteine-rich CWC family protein [Collimonas arenae]